MNRLLWLVPAMIAGHLLSGCYVFSAFQGARMLPAGKTSVTPSASFLTFKTGDESWKSSDNFGAQVAHGVSERVNLTVRYEHLDWSQADESHNYLDLGVKVSIVPDILAVALPVGFFFGSGVEEGESFQAHPTVLATLPLHPNLDVNVSAKYLIFFDPDADNLAAYNAGLGVRLLPGKFTVFPEIGLLHNPGESGYYTQWGLGFGLEF